MYERRILLKTQHTPLMSQVSFLQNPLSFVVIPQQSTSHQLSSFICLPKSTSDICVLGEPPSNLLPCLKPSDRTQLPTCASLPSSSVSSPLSACLVSHYLLWTVPSLAKSVNHAAMMVCAIITATGAFAILWYVSHSDEDDLQIALQELPK